jgi:uncharacterized phage infection (PIP) family protein YhgE
LKFNAEAISNIVNGAELEDYPQIIEQLSSKISKPIVNAIVKAVIENLAELKPAIQDLNKFLTENQIQNIEALKKSGLTKREAVLLSLSTRDAFKNLANAELFKMIKTACEK